MKYDELIKELKECDACLRFCVEYCPKTSKLNKDGKCPTTLTKKAADAIEELQNRLEQALYMPLPKWIPVTERLPGMGEVVLVYGKRGGIYTAEHNRNGCWPGSFWKLNSKSHHCDPTHWMPLPEPPKDGGD